MINKSNFKSKENISPKYVEILKFIEAFKRLSQITMSCRTVISTPNTFMKSPIAELSFDVLSLEGLGDLFFY